MSVQQDRLTFFGVLLAVVVVVIGYLQLGQMYPVAGRADAPKADPAQTQPEAESGESGHKENDKGPDPAKPDDSDP